MITCEGWTSQLVTIGNTLGTDQLVERTYTYKIRGHFDWDDGNESEKSAMLIVEDVIEALDGDTTLHGSTYAATGEHPVADLLFEPRTFGDVLVHFAEITQQVKELQ